MSIALSCINKIDDYFNLFHIFLFGTEVLWPSNPLPDQLFAIVSKTGAERQKDYSDNYGQAVKLCKLRRSG